ncbi:MAG: glycoside hydrolase family 2 TIM barrel-domain containing protein [Bacteroidales bacterium]|nr:glycoside hydrolase family 2 TIM barrel-domain containing protein [Bacteroidales bacterium]
MKIIHWIVPGLVLILSSSIVYRAMESEPRVNTTIDLNWRFIQGDPEGAFLPEYNDSHWRYLSLPHDWMIEQKAESDHPSGTAGDFNPGGTGWYRKSIDLSVYHNKDQFYLLFEGLMRNADVYFNGTHLGKQENAYSGFCHDLSELVRMDTLNVIAVRTACSKLPGDRQCSGGGICSHVRLITTSSLHMEVWGEAVNSVIETSGRARMDVSVEFRNNSRKERRFELWYDILGPDGKLVAEGKSNEYLDRNSHGKATSSFTIENPLLWSPETPDLYTVHCYLRDGNRKLDHVSIRHGIRSAQFDPDRGFILNGQVLILKGVRPDHDGGEPGAAVPLETWKRRLGIYKEQGLNTLKLAPYPHAPEVLDLCDRMGFLVIESGLSDFMQRDRNHPSVILRRLGNESTEQLFIPGTKDGHHEIPSGLIDYPGESGKETPDSQSSIMANNELDGPGRIKANDQGDLADLTPSDADSKPVRKGKQLLILQAGGEPGDLVISAAAEGLNTSKTEILLNH